MDFQARARGKTWKTISVRPEKSSLPMLIVVEVELSNSYVTKTLNMLLRSTTIPNLLRTRFVLALNLLYFLYFRVKAAELELNWEAQAEAALEVRVVAVLEAALPTNVLSRPVLVPVPVLALVPIHLVPALTRLVLAPVLVHWAVRAFIEHPIFARPTRCYLCNK
jgi:hypothetical protein